MLGQYMLIGTGVGIGVASVALSYAAGVDKKSSGPFSLLFPVSGVAFFLPGVGGAAGAGAYGLQRSLRYLRTAPRPIQIATTAVAGTALASGGAYYYGAS
ncbi:MAG: hypothetical protein KDK78_06500 [Chlamydiia bacterium]|nr:hypothetical protein [Chlamydiia bacterium]